MSNTSSSTSVSYANEKVTIQNTKTQDFSEDDFVDVYDDMLTRYQNLKDNIEDMEEQREELLDERGDELAALNTALGREGHDTDLEPGVISEEAIEADNQLQQIKEQLKGLRRQLDMQREQLREMAPVAQEISDDAEEFEP